MVKYYDAGRVSLVSEGRKDIFLQIKSLRKLFVTRDWLHKNVNT